MNPGDLRRDGGRDDGVALVLRKPLSENTLGEVSEHEFCPPPVTAVCSDLFLYGAEAGACESSCPRLEYWVQGDGRYYVTLLAR